MRKFSLSSKNIIFTTDITYNKKQGIIFLVLLGDQPQPAQGDKRIILT